MIITTDLPKGIHRVTKLPSKALGELWQSIFVDKKVKVGYLFKQYERERGDH